MEGGAASREARLDGGNSGSPLPTTTCKSQPTACQRPSLTSRGWEPSSQCKDYHARPPAWLSWSLTLLRVCGLLLAGRIRPGLFRPPVPDPPGHQPHCCAAHPAPSSPLALPEMGKGPHPLGVPREGRGKKANEPHGSHSLGNYVLGTFRASLLRCDLLAKPPPTEN